MMQIHPLDHGCDGKPDRCRNRVQVSLPHSFAVPVMEQQNFQRL
jgi:hypothetical protein